MGRIFLSTVFVITASMGLAGCTSASTAGRAGDTAADIAGGEALNHPAKITVPSGTYLRVVLQDGLSTDKNSSGDVFKANLSESVVVEGQTVLEKGAIVHGRVVDVLEPGRVKGRATLKLSLTSVEHHGKPIPIETRTYIGVAHNTKKRDTKVIGGAAGVGAVIGAIAGGGAGAAEGAAIGGGAGTGVVLATKGDQLRYPPETRLHFRLSSPAEM